MNDYQSTGLYQTITKQSYSYSFQEKTLIPMFSLREGETLVDLLLSKDADVNTKSASSLIQTSSFQQFPLFHPQAEFFIDTSIIQTALHFCASKNNLDVARKLIAHKASARVKDKREQLPLHRAAAVGSVPMVKLLLENKSPLNATDVSGYTALHHAISEGHGDTALVLLKAGAEVDKRDVDGHLAIDLAPDTKVCVFYCQRIADFTRDQVDSREQIKKFILQSAEREGIDLSVEGPPKD
ncbi:MAG: hypothetical protein Q9182_005647 [Xanthomendoza sp. 2 TL-2023]